MKLKSAFLTPAIQRNLWNKLGFCPRVFPQEAAAEIEALNARRSICDESEIDGIDSEIEKIAEANASAGKTVSTAINKKRARIQTALDRRDSK